MTLALASRDYDGDGGRLPVVILHGLFGSARNWHSIASKLAADGPVHALDLRNHGASPWAQDVAYTSMADDVMAFCHSRGIERAHLVGHSMGGKVAMTLALGRPQQCASLAVIDIAPVTYPPHHQSIIGAMRALPVSAMSRRAEADERLSATISDVATRQFLLQNLVAKDGRLNWRINLGALDEGMASLSGFPEALVPGSFSAPVLFVAGGKSDYIASAHRSAVRRYFPQAVVETVERAGHWVHADEPGKILALLQSFFSSSPH